MWIAGSRAWAGAAALALSIAAIAEAQQAQPGAGTASEAHVAASPAVKRLQELLGAVNSGDPAVMQAYVQENGLQAAAPPPGLPGALPLIGSVLDLHRRSQGLDLVRVATADDSGAVAIVRNRLTGDEQALAVKIEPQAPHRMTGLPNPPSALAAALARPAAAGLSEQARLQQIGSYLRRLADADIFSGVVLIVRDGEPVLSQAYGHADRERKIANTVDTPFNLASTSKIFTGLAIGQLVEQGRLSYEDPLSKFLPDFPDAESAGRIRVKHLLSHTAGLGQFMNPAYFDSLDQMRSVQAVLGVAGREPPKFEPGTSWDYSNTGYLLLGRIIEIVTGQDYYDSMQENVFVPAGMTSASFPHQDRNPGTMAIPYEIEYVGGRLHHANQFEKAYFPRRGGPFGGAVVSAPDLVRLADALRAGRIVKPETFRLHASPKPELASPRYGYGFMATARTGEPLLGHGGNLPGVCTDFGTVTDTPYTIVVLSNATINTCISVTAKILQVLAPAGSPA